MSDKWFTYRFKRLMQTLQNRNPLLRGLRVFERHPGEVVFGDVELSHGLHAHFLVNQRVCKHWLEREGRKWGFGFTWVDTVDLEEALYCAKYLTKDGTDLQRGGRKWGTIGGFRQVCVNHIEMDSTFHRNFRKVQQWTGIEQTTPDLLNAIFLNSEKFGDIEQWPSDRLYYGNRSRELLSPEMLGYPVKDYADPTMKPLRFTRINRTKEQRHKRLALIWKAKGNQRRERIQLCAADSDFPTKIERVEPEARPSGKNFFEPPRVSPGASPVKSLDRTVSQTVYWLDKKPRKMVGTHAAITKAWKQKTLFSLPG